VDLPVARGFSTLRVRHSACSYAYAMTKEETPIKTDAQLQHDVTEALNWEPSLNPTHIDVAIKDGVESHVTVTP